MTVTRQWPCSYGRSARITGLLCAFCLATGLALQESGFCGQCLCSTLTSSTLPASCQADGLFPVHCICVKIPMLRSVLPQQSTLIPRMIGIPKLVIRGCLMALITLCRMFIKIFRRLLALFALGKERTRSQGACVFLCPFSI